MIDEMIYSFQRSRAFLEKSVADLQEREMVAQPAGLPNHATWTLGHVAFSCQGLTVELGGKPWLPDDWEAPFGYGSKPSPEIASYPNRAEMLAFLADSSDRLQQALRAIDNAFLNKSNESLPDESFPTMGHLLLQVVVGHTAYHAGQLAVWRRAIGKPSGGVFV